MVTERSQSLVVAVVFFLVNYTANWNKKEDGLTVAVGEVAVDLALKEINNLILQLFLDALQKVIVRHVPLRDG